jgi:hypothetical protein
LKVFIGFAQTSIMVDSKGNEIFGSSAVYIDDQLMKIGVINNLVLGTASQLKNKKVTILTTVLDIQPATNNTSVSYVFSGGTSVETFTTLEEVSSDMGAVLHRADIRIIG